MECIFPRYSQGSVGFNSMFVLPICVIFYRYTCVTFTLLYLYLYYYNVHQSGNKDDVCRKVSKINRGKKVILPRVLCELAEEEYQ